MQDYSSNSIGMLLDIEHLYGEHEGRMGPLIISLLLSAAPILLYIYLGLYMTIPIPVFAVVDLIYTARVFMIIMGRERYRVELYRKQLNDEYMSTASMLNIKTIHPDGCIEYMNSRIAYLVCCFNGTAEDDIQRSIQLRKFLETMLGEFEFDTYIHNIVESPALREYYNDVARFNKNRAAVNFIDIIDHNIELTKNTSVVQCTIYAIKGTKSDWRTIRNQIDAALNSRTARCYKLAYRVSNPDEIGDILNRNIDSVINISDLLRRKYATTQYDSSKVLAYDLPPDKEIVQGREAQVKVISDVPAEGSFHISYDEIPEVRHKESTIENRVPTPSAPSHISTYKPNVPPPIDMLEEEDVNE